ncbi:hypothetical protein ILYODFUR_031347 [Ilyodon furcidens]|uniref:Uncharacterized protein n=1 Tax=Ilyodon furcidens TaxID=33524 RepID=A0ABV0TEE3_9TELE
MIKMKDFYMLCKRENLQNQQCIKYFLLLLLAAHGHSGSPISILPYPFPVISLSLLTISMNLLWGLSPAWQLYLQYSLSKATFSIEGFRSASLDSTWSHSPQHGTCCISTDPLLTGAMA